MSVTITQTNPPPTKTTTEMSIPVQAIVALDEKTDGLAAEVSALSATVLQLHALLEASNARNTALATQVGQLTEVSRAATDASKQERLLADANTTRLKEELAKQKERADTLAQQIQNIPAPYVPPIYYHGNSLNGRP